MNAPNYNIKTLIVGEDVTIGERGFVTNSREDFDNLVDLFKAGVTLYVQGYGKFSEDEYPYYINELVIKYMDAIGEFDTITGIPIIKPLT